MAFQGIIPDSKSKQPSMPPLVEAKTSSRHRRRNSTPSRSQKSRRSPQSPRTLVNRLGAGEVLILYMLFGKYGFYILEQFLSKTNTYIFTRKHSHHLIYAKKDDN
ncbi:unnamed protein product [Cuscuta europaea]|uniref:Uncharacterized protein n=1 Tax=Cuscuta europaea TaxID=41803 RepID=A0A9P1DX24_CUSEU|nr:unnamed protein product [Cuscuta europaea]